MATLRKGICYTRPTTRSYTRVSKYKNKGFVKAVPNSKLTRFHMGDKTKKFDNTVELIADTKFNIRHNALESCRIVVNKQLSTKLGTKNYHFRVKSFPHQVMRENKLLSGARADRLQTGMKHSFGKPIGRSAAVKKGSKIFEVSVDKVNLAFVSKLLKSVKTRLPGRVAINVI